MTNPTGMRCITKMSYRPACVIGGLSRPHLFTETVVCNDKAWHAFPWQSRLTSNKTLLAIGTKRTHIHTSAKASIKFTYGWYNYHYRSLELRGGDIDVRKEAELPRRKEEQGVDVGAREVLVAETIRKQQQLFGLWLKTGWTTTSFPKKMILGGRKRDWDWVKESETAFDHLFILFYCIQ